MKRSAAWSGLAVAAVLLAACGSGTLEDLCDEWNTCAIKSAKAFSVTECKQSMRILAEKAETRGCGSEYGKFADCVVLRDWQCTEFLSFETVVAAECGAHSREFEKCMN